MGAWRGNKLLSQSRTFCMIVHKCLVVHWNLIRRIRYGGYCSTLNELKFSIKTLAWTVSALQNEQFHWVNSENWHEIWIDWFCIHCSISRVLFVSKRESVNSAIHIGSRLGASNLTESVNNICQNSVTNGEEFSVVDSSSCASFLYPQSWVAFLCASNQFILLAPSHTKGP